MRVLIEEQKPIEAQCRCYTGHVLTAREADSINAYLHDINKLAGKVIDTNSMQFKERELWLDRRHKYFCAVIGVNQAKRNN